MRMKRSSLHDAYLVHQFLKYHPEIYETLFSEEKVANIRPGKNPHVAPGEELFALKHEILSVLLHGSVCVVPRRAEILLGIFLLDLCRFSAEK